jgi:hypothetical protein
MDSTKDRPTGFSHLMLGTFLLIDAKQSRSIRNATSKRSLSYTRPDM